MLRRSVLLLTALGAMFTLGVIGSQKRPGVLVLEWAILAPVERRPGVSWRSTMRSEHQAFVVAGLIRRHCR